ncbi:MAG: M20/M25/M40 family metallo-hydrolase, partial [Lachnospiraceae bacterium]|nr:M20/M25/M40 family metallo-hydrolase [Lachnospiraceae bacterium]
RLLCLTKGFGGEAVVRSSYPAWEYRQDSPFRDLCVSTYKELTGKEPGVEVIHAGLECGILAGKVEGLDCISAGPDLENVHTVKERMKISSVEKVWTFVRRLLEAASEEEQLKETASEEEQPEEMVPAEDLD